MSLYTEQGVVSRRDRSPAELVAEIRDATRTRHERLLADPPTDGTARPTPIFGGVPWDWNTLLRNRPLDVWMHEQDIRRAVDRPGGMDSPAAAHVADYLAESLGYVLAKRAGAPPGTTLVLAVEGHAPRRSPSTRRARGCRSARSPTSRPCRWRWTASPSSCSRAGAGSPSRGGSGSRATRSSPSGSSTVSP